MKRHDWQIEPREYARQEERRGRRFAFTHLTPARTALVVVDMIPFFVTPGSYAEGIVPNIQALIAAVRDCGGLVVWVVPAPRQTHPELAREFFGETIAELYRTSGGGGPIAGRIAPDFVPKPWDLMIEKTSYSAFHPESAPLAAMLKSRGVDTVLITGTLTNICCESSARDACSSGFRVVMLADANAARRDIDHNMALYSVYRSFGDVRTTGEVIDLLCEAQAAFG
ncbi:isochorismatase family cysteine hydrolase [Rhizobium sp. CF142]|uniref:isochorismatase family cysteine hydrolase n=1 Tax=Rhizobium sp. CF142 TaxID=1144314 RepID=UPI00026EE9B2|nr:isochorismatase family cysteine hydrolase [Rhizobium sp. CF142]EJJ29735.1 nicotinamidase-like amidase [Rhizobium sp. CF142]